MEQFAGCIAQESKIEIVANGINSILNHIYQYNKTVCPPGLYGDKCENTCGLCALGATFCDPRNGHCYFGCETGWEIPLCKNHESGCPRGLYGDQCKNICGLCELGAGFCDPINGHCSFGCKTGWKRPLCKKHESGVVLCNGHNQTLSSSGSECLTNTSLALMELLTKNFTKQNMENITAILKNLTSNTNEVQSYSIQSVTEIMEKLTNSPGLYIGEKVLSNQLGAISNILSANATIFRNASRMEYSPNRLIKAFEKCIDQIDLNNKSYLKINTMNVVISHYKIQQNSKNISRGIAVNFGSKQLQIDIKDKESMETMDTMDASIYLQDTFFNESLELVKGSISFMIYKNSKLFQETADQNETGRRNASYSPILAIKIGNSDIKTIKLHDPVILYFLPQVDKLETWNFTATCVYWNFTGNKGRGGWSSDGCVYNGTRNNRIICLCYHLTNFAVLLNINSRNKIKYDFGLELISYIGCALSIVGLTFTLIILFIIRHLNSTARKIKTSTSNQTLFNLITALLFTMIIFVSGIHQTRNKFVCIAVAMLLHYFLLVSFFWMLIEGVLHYYSLVKIIQANSGTYSIWKLMLFSWGCPAIIIGITASVDYSLYYGGHEFCWLSRNLLIYGLVCPVAIILAINAVIFALIIQSIFCRKTVLKRSKELQFLWLRIRGIICTMFLTGLTWFFGIFSMIYDNMVFQYLFCIFNSSQGLFIAIFFYLVLINKPEWTEFRAKCICVKNKTSHKKLSNATDTSYFNSKGN